MPSVVTFGDALWRLSTAKGERLVTATQLDFILGGTELNVAVNLRSLGQKAEWVSCLPEGLMGELIDARVQQYGVKSTHCQTIPGGQAGWYMLEAGAAPRPDLVYERRASSIAQLKEFSFDWHKILGNTKIFHTSGVTAGTSAALTQEIAKAMKVARALGVKVSYDFNYRRTLWSLAEFVERQKPLLPLIDILFCSPTDLELFFNRSFSDGDYSAVFQATQLQTLVLSWRSADESQYGVDVITPQNAHQSRRHTVQSIDRIGVGDAMTAGFLWGVLEGDKVAQCAEKAAATGAFKYSIKGDMAFLRPQEVLTYLEQGYRGVIR